MAVYQICSLGCVALSKGLIHNATLCQLWLSGNAIGMEGAVALGEALEHNKALKWLYLSHDASLQKEGVDRFI